MFGELQVEFGTGYVEAWRGPVIAEVALLDQDFGHKHVPSAKPTVPF